MVANGPTPDCVRNHPALKNVSLPPTGKPERGGSVVTKALVFSGEGGGMRYVPWAGGPIFRAYDKKTGEIVHEFTLPGNQTGNPMTYMVGGKQYIVVAIGSRTQNSEYVALSLP
jgi:quinoprotein glucose dehydrogenase